MTRLGGDVIGKEAEDVGNEEILSFESLMMEKPDVIFIQSVPERDENVLQGVYDHPAFRQVPAVLNKRVYTIPFYTIRCPVVRVSDAITIFTGDFIRRMYSSKAAGRWEACFCLPQA